MSTAIHENHSSITTMDGIEIPTQLPSEKNSTQTQGVPIITNASLYTTLPNNINKVTIDSSHIGSLYKPHWVYSLDEALANVSNDNIVIVKQYQKKDKSVGFCYSVYPKQQVPYYVLSLSAEKRVYFEYLRGARKPYFDLELKRKSGVTQRDIIQFYECIKLLLSSINNALLSKKVKYHPDTNLIIWCSHSKEKLSVHIIIDRHYHVDNIEARAFYDLCVSSIPQDVLGYLDDDDKRHIIVDKSVYDNRPFRMPWCTKLGENRPLGTDPMFKSNYIPGPLDANDILEASPDKKQTLLTEWLFQHSLICNLADCEPLPSFINPKAPLKKKSKKINDDMMNLFLECYNSEPNLTNNYTVREDLSSDYLYLQKNGIVRCIINEHGSHKNNNSMITFNSYLNAVVFQCFAHTGYKILRTLKDQEDQDTTDEIDYSVGSYIGGFNIETGELDKEKEYEASFQRNATQNDVIYFINSLEKTPSCNVDSKSLRNKFKVYCDNNKLDSWFKQKQFDDLLMASYDIDKIVNKEGTLYISGVSTSNIDRIYRKDLPENLRKITMAPGRVRATAIMPQNGSEIIALEPINTTQQYPIVFVKRPATTDDVKHFIDSIRVNDTTKCGTCPQLYEEFNNYCNRSELYTSVGNRQFSNFVSKCGHYSISKDRQNRTIVIGVSLLLSSNVKRTDNIKFETLIEPDAVSSTWHSNNNHILNNICKINNEVVQSGPVNVPATINTVIADKKLLLTSTQSTNVPATINTVIADKKLLLTSTQSTNVPATINTVIADKKLLLTSTQSTNVPATDISVNLNNNVKFTLDQGINSIGLKEFTEPMIRDFWDAEMVQDINSRINIVAVNKSFEMWCKENNVYSNLKMKGLSRLLTNRLSLRRVESNGIRYIVGWNVRRSISKEEHDKKEDGLRKIFECWTDRYEIGRHNGAYPYYHIGTSQWRGVRVNHDYVYTMGTNGRIKMPGLESMMSIPGDDREVNAEDGFILCMKADLGSGKTETIKEYIEANPNMRIIYVVPAKNIIFGRQTKY